MSAPPGQQLPTLWHVCEAWLRQATEIVVASADALDAMNVFPVPDADTGTNLRLTLAGIVRALPAVRSGAAERPPVLDTLVSAAISAAHGNSGAILAEMFTSACRSLEHDSARLPGLPPGVLLAQLLRTVATAARRAVARPVAGTILTVADDTASAAGQAATTDANDVLGVALAAQIGAQESLARTPSQLPVLATAGVVDAGGQAYKLLVDVLVEVLGGPAAVPLALPAISTRTPRSRPASVQKYEVMYALEGASPSSLDRLRERLSELGDSVVVVGEETMAQVHVHLGDAGSAVEAALGIARLSGIRVTALPEQPEVARRSVICVVAGAGLAAAVAALGGLPLLAAVDEVVPGALAELVERTCGDVVILPNDAGTLETAGELAARLRVGGRRVAVIPTLSQVQGLAALGVHEPTADFDAVVVAMSSAVGHVRYGAVSVAERPALTGTGRCEPGQVLGAVQGNVVEIGASVVEVAWRVVERLLLTGGELLTLVAGIGADDTLVPELTARVRRSNPGLDVEVVAGHQPRYLLLVGLE